jgi:hypothetical protein
MFSAMRNLHFTNTAPRRETRKANMNTQHAIQHGHLVLAAAVGLSLACGCSTTYQMRAAERSGFLKDYGQLKDNKSDAALLSYVDPQTDFKLYSKVLLEPVRAYAANQDSDIAKLPREKQQDLVNYFDAALRENLKRNFALVNEPGPGVIRLRVALTEAKGANVLLDTTSSIVPFGIALSGVSALATGKHLSVGEVGAECEGLDAVTGHRLFAAVDARVGRKYTFRFDKFSKWRTAKDACNFWAERLSTRMAERCGRQAAAR